MCRNLTVSQPNITAANDDSIYEDAKLTDLLETADTAFPADLVVQIATSLARASS